MSGRTRCKKPIRRARPLPMPAYLIIRDFPIGLSVPYILASDGVFSFSFWQNQTCGRERILQEGIMTLVFLVRAWLF